MGNKATEAKQREILDKGIGNPVDPTTGHPSVIVKPDGEYGPLGYDKVKENVSEFAEKVDDFFCKPIEANKKEGQ